jgi:hypothetical protein
MAECIWLQLAGHGFVTADHPSSTVLSTTLISGNVYDVEVLFTPIYAPAVFEMANQVGSRIVVKDYPAGLNIPDGPYTLVAVDAGLSRLTFRGEFAVAPVAGPAIAATVRVEDFYKFCNFIPDFVTGTDAKQRWLQVIETDAFSATLGQKIDVKGGVASFDGFSLSCIYQNTPPVTRLLRTRFEVATDVLNNFMITGDEWAVGQTTFVTKKGPDNPGAQYDATQLPGDPIFIDKEAVIIQRIGGLDPDFNRQLDVSRGVLDTQDFYHDTSSVIYAGLQTAQSAICFIKQLNIETSLGYFEALNVYTGIIENVSFGNGINTFNLEISPQIFASQKNSFAAKINTKSKDVGKQPSTPRQVVVFEQQVPFATWRWAKLGDVCLRLRDPFNPATGHTGSLFTVEPIAGSQGLYDVYLYLDYIVYDPTATGTFIADNGVIVTPSANDIEFEKKSRRFPRLVGEVGIFYDDDLGEVVDTRTGDPSTKNRESLYIKGAEEGEALLTRSSGLAPPYTRSYEVIHYDLEKWIADGGQTKVEPAHVFENQIGLIPEYTDYTDSAELECSAVQCILQVLTSNYGDGSNGPFDTLPYGVGLGIRQDTIDWDSFGIDPDTSSVLEGLSRIAYEKLRYNFINIHFTINDTAKINEWLTKNVLQPLNLGVVQTSEGKVRLIDTADLRNIDGLDILTDNDLEYENGGRNLAVDLSYDASNLFDRVTINEKRLYKNPGNLDQPQDIITTVIPSLFISDEFDETGLSARLFSFLQAEPLTYDVPFTGDRSIANFVSNFVGTYSNVIPNLTFTGRKSALEIGEKFSFNFSQVINSSGERGVQGVGIILDKKTNILAEQAKYRAVILPFLEDATLWAASGEINFINSNTDFIITTNRYTLTSGAYLDGVINDASSFEVGDFIVLYDENFVMLSVDAAGNPDPREITSIISPNNIIIASAFTDGAGVPIAPTSEQIIQHADRSLQTPVPQNYYAWFNSGVSTYEG